MTCTPAQLAANRRNSRLSSGPRTEDGKAASRANSLKHGLTGAGIVVPEQDQAEVDRRSDAFEADLRPRNDVGRFLARRAAALSVRLDRSVRQEFAAVAERVRHADGDYRADRRAEIQRLLAQLPTDPAPAVHQLRRTPEGLDALIGGLLQLRTELVGDPGRWDSDRLVRTESLMGRGRGDSPGPKVTAVYRAGWGDFARLTPEDGAGLSDRDRRDWARRQIAGMIEAELEALGALRDSLDLASLELDRVEAPVRALFDPSNEAALARKYEAATQRDFFRTLHDFHKIEARAEADEAEADEVAANPVPPPDPEELASSFPEPSRPELATPAPASPPVSTSPTPRPLPDQSIRGTRPGPKSTEIESDGGPHRPGHRP